MGRVSNLNCVVIAAFVLATGLLEADVVLNELMYNPPGGKNLEFVELHNTGELSAELAGWKLSAGLDFTFSGAARIPAGGYALLCGDLPAFTEAYPAVSEDAILGEFRGSLANEGEQVTLLDAGGRVVDGVSYDDLPPWDFLADGFGASLERLCQTEIGNAPENWRASAVPPGEEASGGSPAAENAVTLCPPEFAARPAVFFSEIMYHAVREEALVENHEFIELHNAGESTVELAGWRVTGGVDFVFPEGSTLAAGGYVVIAKNRERLAEVEAYALDAATIHGNYERELDNGGERLALIGADGQGIDAMSYDDDAPWPIAADALGAGESWLPRELLPLEDHRYMGRSLERVSFDVPSSELANWVASPLDGATPGRPNASRREQPLPVVASIDVRAIDSEDALIRADQELLVQIAFTPTAPGGAVELEFFVEDIERADEELTKILLGDDGADGDLVAGDAIYSAILPPQPENTVVRYRVLADLGEGSGPVAPRASDPNPWRAYFVSPFIDTETRVYQVFVSRVNWSRMWTNVVGNRVSGCAPSATWNARVPAIFVHEGRVIDAQVRYQGSRWNRTNGRDITRWVGPRPSGPFRALSWRIALPRYEQLEGRRVLTLNKLTQGCPGYNSGVGYRLFGELGLPSPRTRFARLHINGNYYHYMMEYERPGEELVRRWLREREEADPTLPREGVGHLYKSVGCTCDEGPWGWGDGRLLNSFCGHARETRYAYTYDRKIHEWDSHDEFIALVEDLHAARRGGVNALREYFDEHFDIELLMNYVSVINYQVPFDDMFQNHFLYRRLGDGKWVFAPWDLDRNFGEWQGPNSSIFIGEQGNQSNRSGWFNYFKDGFIKAYRQEFQDHLLFLNNTTLHPDHIKELIDIVSSEVNPQEAAQAPAGVACNFTGRPASFMSFALSRFRFINNLSGINVQGGPDVTVYAGETFVLDGSDSSPDPDDETLYSWRIPALDESYEGERVEARIDTAGEYEALLTLSLRGLPLEDSVTITVLPRPSVAFFETTGTVVMEAEHFVEALLNDTEDGGWEEDPGIDGVSRSAMLAGGESRYLSTYVGRAPELRFPIKFETAGVYRLWIRGFAEESTNDSLHVSINGEARGSTLAHGFDDEQVTWEWSGVTRRDAVQELEVARPGLQYFSLYVREIGLLVDKIVLTTDPDFAPEGAGPAESRRASLDGAAEPFVRGDVSSNGRLEISDAIAILGFLFRGATIACEDHADVDDDGNVAITDAVRLLGFLFQRGEAPAAPFPEPGFDLSVDRFACGG